MKAKPKTEIIKHLKKNIEEYEEDLMVEPETHIFHYKKADDLVKLAEVTEDRSYYSEALRSYTRAIDLSPQNRTYLADRSKLHVILGRADLAAQDLLEVQKSPSTGDGALDLDSNYTTKNILKLGDVQFEVKKLITNGQIPKELEGVFSGMIEVISGISLRVSSHDETLKDHGSQLDTQAKELTKMKEKVAKLEEKYGQYQEAVRIIGFMSVQIQELQHKVQEHNAAIGKHDESIEVIKGQITKLCSREEFEALAHKFDKVENEQVLFGGKMKIIEGRLNGQESSIATIDQTLKQSNCFNRQGIKEGFEALKTDGPDGAVIYDYANNFYWSLSNYLLAYRAISSGAVRSISDMNQLEKIWDKVGSCIIKVTGAIPVVGGMLALIESGIMSINSAYKDMKFARKVGKINELITGFILEEDLNLAIANASIQIAKMKKSDIVSQYQQKYNERKDEQKPSTFKKAKDTIGEKVEAFNTKVEFMLTKIKTSEDTTGKIMAIKDVILFLNYIATNEVVLINNQNDVATFDQAITQIFRDNIANTDKAIQNAVEVNTASSESGKCIVSMLYGVTYDNSLLNHPELLSKAINYFGMNKAVDLSELLDDDLISQAIEGQDNELVLAGMMSLD